MSSQEGGFSKMLFNTHHCSPSADTSNGSCLDDELIRKVGRIMNKMRTKNKQLEHIQCNSNTEKIHECICKNIMKISDCDSEACILTVREIMDHLGSDVNKFKDSFRPMMPKKWIKDFNEWLTTSDIENVLNQYMDGDDSFYFYGAVPIDFSNCSVSL